MGQPCVRKVFRCVFMALPAPLHEIGLYERRVGASGADDIMGAVAVRADRYLPGGLVELLSLLFVKAQSHSVKIREVGLHDIGRKSIFVHYCLVGMAVAAHIRYLLPVIQCQRVFNIMGHMTVYAYRHILIMFVKEGLAMYAFDIYIIYSGMTLLASFGYESAFFSEMRYRMRAVAVRTYGGLKVSLPQLDIMDAVHRLGIFVKMTASAGL